MVAAKQEKRKHQFSNDGKRHLWIVGKNTYSFRAPKSDRYYYDYEEGQRWVDWSREYFRHTEGELQGEPVELLEHNEIIVRELFGWRSKETGFRRYKTAFIFVPEKNQKTQMGMILSVGLAKIDEEPGAQVYWAAATKEQAERTCWKMISDTWATPECSDLHDLFELRDSAMSLYDAESKSVMQIISSIPGGKHGLNVSGAILDEIHETPNDDTRNVLRSKMVTRRQPLLIYITTAGKSRQHWSYKEYLYAKSIDDGTRDTEAADQYLTFIREAPEDIEDKLTSTKALIEAVRAANPAFGIAVKEDNVLLQWEEAQADPAKKDMFLQCKLNLWVERYSDYLARGAWKLCADPGLSLEQYAKKKCFIGVDLSESQDMSAVDLLFPEWMDGDILYTLFPHYFLPSAAYYDKAKHELYKHWGLRENLEICGEVIIEYKTIREKIKAFGEQFQVVKVLLDPAYANEFATALRDEDKFEVEYVKQKGWHTAGAVRRFKELVNTGRIRHPDNAILNHNVQNAKVVKDKETDLERISKATSSGKIDGLMGGIFALHGALDYVPEEDFSEYFKKGSWSL